MNVEQLVKDQKGTIVDVRTYGEFIGGNVAGSVNIPLDEVPYRVEQLREMEQPLILCCVSGNRSGMATDFLRAQGIACVNGGAWTSVNYYQSLIQNVANERNTF